MQKIQTYLHKYKHVPWLFLVCHEVMVTRVVSQSAKGHRNKRHIPLTTKLAGLGWLGKAVLVRVLHHLNRTSSTHNSHIHPNSYPIPQQPSVANPFFVKPLAGTICIVCQGCRGSLRLANGCRLHQLTWKLRKSSRGLFVKRWVLCGLPPNQVQPTTIHMSMM